MQTSVQIAPCRPEFRERLVQRWRASFEHGVGAPVPHPVDDPQRFLDEHQAGGAARRPAPHMEAAAPMCA